MKIYKISGFNGHGGVPATCRTPSLAVNLRTHRVRQKCSCPVLLKVPLTTLLGVYPRHLLCQGRSCSELGVWPPPFSCATRHALSLGPRGRGQSHQGDPLCNQAGRTPSAFCAP